MTLDLQWMIHSPPNNLSLSAVFVLRIAEIFFLFADVNVILPFLKLEECDFAVRRVVNKLLCTNLFILFHRPE